ncbi:MAG: hypothetical protein ACRD1G_00930 [Acidimicrobiales bacterium]
MHNAFDDTSHDTGGIPVAMPAPFATMPRFVRVAIVVSLIVVFTMLGLTVFGSDFAHIWPASNSAQLKL